MSVIIGGGFASGQEVLQFFTHFGLWGVAGTLVAGLLFAFLGMQVARIGTQLRAHSHKVVLNAIFGERLGSIIDLALIFFLFGVGVAMLAGTGSLFREHFGLPLIVGGLFMTVLVSLTLCLNVQRIVDLISAVTPLLLCLVIVLVIYALFRSDASIESLNTLAAAQHDRAAPNWFLGGVLYASFNIAVGFPLLAVLSGASSNLRNTTYGGVLGGLGLGVLILLLNVGLFANLDQIQGAEMPTVLLAKHLSPWLGWLMMISLCCMIYSTAVGMFFAFSARFADPETPKFRIIGTVSAFVGLGLSFAGFTTLVGTVYPLLGYLGIALILGVAWYWWKNRQAA
ncbi:YkvI family membrane protein [Castellaniella caeni]|uniref:YkvI family membrane protein n=1 Tax=Castellaniella caeni TaxID=266123 RepID=UPI000AC46EFA|nr:hypothetical protein [Castellaniella caeni]